MARPAADDMHALTPLACGLRVPHSGGVADKVSDTILRIVERTPQWIRHDLLATDVAVRQRAEETLAIMIATALEGGTESPPRH